MRLRVLGSSSHGNGYILTDNSGQSLLIEAGVKLSVLQEALDYDISHIAGLLVSHEHGDHSKYLRDYLTMGVQSLALESVFIKHQLHNKKNPFVSVVNPNAGYIVGNFKVITFPVEHDVPNVGFIIIHNEGKFAFLTDTMTSNYTLPKNLTSILIEANYSAEKLNKAVESGATNEVQLNRIIQTHCEINTTKEILQDTDLSVCRNIVLLHLSSQHGDGEGFTKTIQSATGIPTYIAKSGLDIQL